MTEERVQTALFDRIMSRIEGKDPVADEKRRSEE